MLNLLCGQPVFGTYGKAIQCDHCLFMFVSDVPNSPHLYLQSRLNIANILLLETHDKGIKNIWIFI